MKRHTKVAVAFVIALMFYGALKFLPTAFEHMRGAAAQHQMALSRT